MVRVRVYELMNAQGYSQIALSDLTGICASRINDLCWSDVRGIQFWELDVLCKVLSCTPNDILLIQPEGVPQEQDILWARIQKREENRKRRRQSRRAREELKNTINAADGQND